MTGPPVYPADLLSRRFRGEGVIRLSLGKLLVNLSQVVKHINTPLNTLTVDQGLRQGCVLAPLMFNMFFTEVLCVAEKRFLTDTAVTDNMVQLQRKEKGEKKGTSRTGKIDGRGGEEEEEGVQILWGLLYADDAGNVSRSSDGLEIMMSVIVTACSAFGLSVSEAKTEIMCLLTERGGKVSFTINAAGQVFKQSSLCTWAELSPQTDNLALK